MSIFKNKEARLGERRHFRLSLFPKQEHRLHTQVKHVNVYSRLDKATASKKSSRSQGQCFYGQVTGERFDFSPLLTSSNHFTCQVQGTYEPANGSGSGGTDLDLQITMCKTGRIMMMGWIVLCVALIALFAVLGQQGLFEGVGTIVGFIAICGVFAVYFMRMNFRRTAQEAMDSLKSVLSIKD